MTTTTEEPEPERCRVCLRLIDVMAFQRTGACCGKHLEQLEGQRYLDHINRLEAQIKRGV